MEKAHTKSSLFQPTRKHHPKMILTRDPKHCGGAKGYCTIRGGDDDGADDDDWDADGVDAEVDVQDEEEEDDVEEEDA